MENRHRRVFFSESPCLGWLGKRCFTSPTRSRQSKCRQCPKTSASCCVKRPNDFLERRSLCAGFGGPPANTCRSAPGCASQKGAVADVALDQLVDSPVPFNDKTSQCQKRRQARQLFRFDRPGRNLWDEQPGACGMRGGRHGLASRLGNNSPTGTAQEW